jgi:plastocyanin
MRITRTWLLAGAMAAALGCSSNSTTAPNNGGTGGTAGTGGGPVGAVIVGNDFFQSSHNGTRPALDTVTVGQPVTWTWTGTGSISHSVLSEGTPNFTSSTIMTGDGMTYTFTFTTAGTYHYQCAVHGAAMSGTVVVQ